MDNQMGTVEPGKLAYLTVVKGDSYFDPKTTIHSVWIDGQPILMDPPSEKKSVAEADIPTSVDEAESGEPQAREKRSKTTKPEVAESKLTSKAGSDKKRLSEKPRVAREPNTFQEPLPHQSGVWIRNATVWTCGPQGVLTNAHVWIQNGRVRSVTREMDPINPTGTVTILDGTGLHVTPGLIDAHSHSMILGGVNESGLPSTAMVRISDVVNSESENILLQLAGGLTVANLLHGSANPIGGQNSVIKLRLGASPEGLIFESAPAGIKFALGENVKQSRMETATRFPQSRMGVPNFFVNRFRAAQEYQKQWALWRSAPSDHRRPHRDLEMEALSEILQGTRLIHCHSYRQDEIVAFLRTMESFQVRVATLQHVLEGYKVADEIAGHGAGASAFSDWWGFKFEVLDAIPYAGSLMRERGVLVSFNSDSSDHARRMNLEAAKAVKYGNTFEAEALKFVTLNPAIQLGIADRVGSLESGKDGDFVLWSGHPLDTTSVCLETWIEGKPYFKRSAAKEHAQALEQERLELVEKARSLKGPAEDTPPTDAPANPEHLAVREAFFRQAIERARHLAGAECLSCDLP
jgi:imidazolonepropionase-like amidohydrolase